MGSATTTVGNSRVLGFFGVHHNALVALRAAVESRALECMVVMALLRCRRRPAADDDLLVAGSLTTFLIPGRLSRRSLDRHLSGRRPSTLASSTPSTSRCTFTGHYQVALRFACANAPLIRSCDCFSECLNGSIVHRCR